MTLKAILNLLNYLLLLLSAGISLWYGAEVLNQPFAIARISSLLPMMLALLVFFNRTFTFTFTLKKIKTGNHRIIVFIGKWLLTLFLPILVISQINEVTNTKSEHLVTEKFENLILHLDKERQSKQPLPDDLLDFLQTSTISKSFNYYYGSAEFMLTTEGGSIDIDGSTLFYHSDYKQWHYIHNDLIDSQSEGELINKFRQSKENLNKNSYTF